MSNHAVQQKKITGFVGSPRRGGNTEILVDEVLAGAAEAGAQTEKVILTDLKIAPCIACDVCRNMHKCVFQDDMSNMMEKMDSSQIWVFGTPVYWWGPTAQFKTFMDRWYGIWNEISFKQRRVILVIPLGDTDAQVARHTVGMFTDAMEYTGADLFATIVANGVNLLGEVRENHEMLAAARRAGRDAILKA